MPTAILDSSPLRGASLIPPPTSHRTEKRGQKRSADEALLLTPPGTVKRERKRTGKRATTTRTTRAAASKAKASSQSRRRARGSATQNETEPEATETEDNAPSLGDGQGRVLEFKHESKRRRTDSIDARLESLLEDAEENPFWDGPKKTSPSTDLADKAEKSVRIRSPTPPVIHFGKGQEPVSPPPSKKRAVKTGKRTVTVEATIEEEEEPVVTAPSTPKKGRKRAAQTVRDSPNNPFLDDDDSPLSIAGEPAEPRTPTAHVEKPTIAYVFRGVRAEFANPMYNLPPEVHERSLLPLTHPDYSPDPVCPPKLLFPKTRKRSASPSPSPTRAGRSKASTMAAAAAVAATGRKNTKPAIPQTLGRGDNDWSDSDDDELHITPPKRLFH